MLHATHIYLRELVLLDFKQDTQDFVPIAQLPQLRFPAEMPLRARSLQEMAEYGPSECYAV